MSHDPASKERANHYSRLIIGAAIEVHRALGPGLLESVYERCLKHELTKHDYKVQTQLWLPVIYDGIEIEGGYKIDLLVEDIVVVELKVVEAVQPVHKAQLLSYLKLSRKEVGLLINFNVVHMRDGIKRLVNTSDPSAYSASSVV